MPKVKVRSSLEHISCDVVRVLGAGDLPKGCCVLRNDLPCTYRMTHVALKLERFIWLDDNGKPNLVLEGYCKSHRPKVGDVVELPSWLSQEVNGKQAGSRIRRLEQAMSIPIVANGGMVVHRTNRESFTPSEPGGNWSVLVETLCSKELKVGIRPTPKEAKELGVCTKCQEAASALASSMTEKE
jgi:hypothetical protein